MLPEVRDCVGDFGTSEPSCSAAPIAIRGIAGDQQAATIGQACFAPGMMKSTYGTGCFALLNTGATPVASQQQAAHHHRLSARRPAHLRAGRLDLRRRLRGAMAARRPAASSSTPARPARSPTNPIPTQSVYLVPAFVGLGAPYWNPRVPRRAVRPDAQHRAGRARARRAGERLLPDLRSVGGDARRLAGADAARPCCASTAA